MKLRDGLKIVMKQQTGRGVCEFQGIYFECNGVQYGIRATYENDCAVNFAIHLDSGYIVSKVARKHQKDTECNEVLKKQVANIPIDKLNERLKEVKKDMQAKGIPYPLND